MTHMIGRRAVLAGGMALATGQAAGQGAPSERGLVIAMPTHPEVLDPVLGNNLPKLRTLPNLFDGLLAFDLYDGMKIRPALAERWRRLDDRTLELELRPGVVFHDGSPVTVEDVVFSLGPVRGLGPGGSGRTVTSQYLATIERVEVTAPNRVQVTTRGPDPLLEQRLAGWTAEIVSRRAFEAAGSWERWSLAPVGTGPYRMAETRMDQRLLLRRHDAYWAGAAPWPSLDFRVVPELAARLNGLATNAYDLVVDVSPDLIPEVEQGGRAVVRGGAIPNTRFVNYDVGHPVLADSRIRRALSLSVDRAAIVASLWASRTVVPHGFQSPAFGPLFIADFPQPRFDPAAARALLREANYGRQEIPYRVMSNYYALEVQTAQVLVEMWAAVGLNVKLTMVEGLSQARRTPIHAMWNESMLMFFPDPLSMALRTHGPNGMYQRITSWKNAEFNDIAGQLAVVLDVEERRRLHRRALEIVDRDDPPCLVLHDNAVLYGMRRDLAWRPADSVIMDFRSTRA
jgi:peptide/nickel transport system substrate-binding protein